MGAVGVRRGCWRGCGGADGGDGGLPEPSSQKEGSGGQTGSTNHANPVSPLMRHQPWKSAIHGSEKAGKSHRAGVLPSSRPRCHRALLSRLAGPAPVPGRAGPCGRRGGGADALWCVPNEEALSAPPLPPFPLLFTFADLSGSREQFPLEKLLHAATRRGPALPSCPGRGGEGWGSPCCSLPLSSWLPYSLP